ncbi:MAG: hypothetical protein AUJ92_14550 [Armatimonadetes bacterium CG2_30_59_28]|nr:MAG: hypothetical protein AUJ92_14550 [Armatimonadetes bacterium CG2_30_59_28]PIX42700.1 MAG: hypothetical protein COZ56_08860 [Armatimonadetes bacterium CG_4_8_14_3_um_filter_58_9]PIY40670.1 MAG: hypothetical protein COZ05_17110 [Armatimonadetes bacterium CG_4_10_14_3_um_filter_59_10]
MLGLFSVAGCVFVRHPFYNGGDNQDILIFFTPFYRLFLTYGWLYYLLEGFLFAKILKRSRLPLFTTPNITLLILRRISDSLSRKTPGPLLSWRAFFFNKHIRSKLLGFVVKAYFGSLMLIFATNHYRTVAEALRQVALPTADLDTRYNLVYHSLFLIDAGLASIGYFSESVLLKNRLKSVDPYPLSWMVTLACYPPFNGGTGELLPLHMGDECQLAFSASALVALKVGTIVLYVIYVWATIALNVKFSNLTHRGVVATGPYAVIRHPAYIGKNMAWWLEYLPYLRNGANILPLIGWNIIYLLRALYEEKHLSADPEYVEYAKQVKYRFIPWVV